MKTLYIVRHGKSSWEEAGLEDHDRPLRKKGEKRTIKIANFLKAKKIKPDLMVTSSAIRAYQTAVIIAEHLNYPVNDILSESALYHADNSDLLHYVMGLDNKINSVMLFGHNLTVTNLANKFLSEKVEWLPTSAIVSISFQTQHWEDCSISKKSTNFVITPKML